LPEPGGPFMLIYVPFATLPRPQPRLCLTVRAGEKPQLSLA
jgi:hypothetical protein